MVVDINYEEQENETSFLGNARCYRGYRGGSILTVSELLSVPLGMLNSPNTQGVEV